MGNDSKRGRSWLGLVLRCALVAGGAIALAKCSGSTVTGGRQRVDGGAGECKPGETRQCVGPGACAGGQKCNQDSHWNDCDCGGVITGAGGGVSTGGRGGQGGTGGVFLMTGGAGSGVDGGSCAAVDVYRDPLPVDMYMMFDQSQSMMAVVPNSNPPATWWQMAQQAVVQFVQDPLATGIGVGLQFFPYNGTVAPASCVDSDYATPEVPIALLPGNSPALVRSIQSHAPTTFTPTASALRGAIQYMQQWGPAHPGRQPVVVLVTDGYPTECDPTDPMLIAQIAQAAYEGTPRVMTFVVGFQSGEALDNLGQIAKAGGTGQAYLIKDGDIGAQFVQAMLGISTTPLDCAFDIPKTTPTGETVDLSQVWVEYVSAATGIPLTIFRLDNLGQCGSAAEGWYYDAPPPASQKIVLCPQTCKKFGASTIHINLGCPGITVTH